MAALPWSTTTAWAANLLSEQLIELEADEGTRLTVYDDGTGQPIGPGSTLVGHPTIGVGRALDVHGISQDEATTLLNNDIANIETALALLPWYPQLDTVRQGVMVNLCYNMGIRGLETFVRMLGDVGQAEIAIKATMLSMAQADYSAAAGELLNSKWATQVQPSRRDRLIQQLKTGQLALPTFGTATTTA